MNDNRAPGWDAKAIHSIAQERFGGLKGLFETMGWSERGATMMTAAGRRVVEAFGSVEAFIAAHPPPDSESLLAQVLPDPPNVWLTSFYGFTPETWGFLGFSNDGQRNRFIRETRPGALVVIYGHRALASEKQRGMVIGVQQVSHRVNNAECFMCRSEWARKSADPAEADKWNLAVKATRAWRVVEESYVPIEDFAPETYSIERARAIGSQGMRLTSAEARGILNLTLIETSVFGEMPITAATPTSGTELFTPSRPGPVSQSGYFCKEAEGPKSLYVLRLRGDESAYLGRPTEGRWIIKVGMSGSPSSRCDALNNSFPAGAFKWEVVMTNQSDGLPFFPRSSEAIQAETQVKAYLHQHEKSLGGEFFLADPKSMASAWVAATSSLKG